MKITKSKTETYTLIGSHGLWAKINLDCGEQSVNVMISSDYGEYSYFWGSTGYTPKKFLCTIEMDYCMKKLMGGTGNMYDPDFKERQKSVNKLIIEERLVCNISKETAREAWDKAKSIFEYCGNSDDLYFSEFMDAEEFEDIFFDHESIPQDKKLKPQVEMFWNNIWLPFTKELKKEYAEHTCGACKAKYTNEPNTTCKECGFVGVEVVYDG